jgi:prepilin-type N-terminal cleavage/methylation domain-containing protein
MVIIKKIRGFTLVELLAVIAILGIIITITIPTVNHILDSSRTRIYNIAVAKIVEGAKDYILQYEYEMPELDQPGVGYVSIETLIAHELLSGSFINPHTKDPFPLTSAVKITKKGNYYEYTFLLEGAPFNVAKGVNKPNLAQGMTPIKWNGSSWEYTTEDDTDWYDYTKKEWANAVTSDCDNLSVLTTCSMWVWVPRYAYQIASGYHASTAGTINIKFLMDETNKTVDETEIYLSPTYNSGNSQTNYIKHPAFKFGDIEITGFWVAKFEPRNNGGVVKVVPGEAAWRNISMKNAFNTTRAMEANSIYGWHNDSRVDTHMMKNSEWGATAYLATSLYGKNSKLSINLNSSFYTGGGSGTSYVTNIGQSTTGNITGIYDMGGGSWTYVMGSLNNLGSSSGWTNAQVEAIPSKYIDRYTNYSADIYGDAVYETTSDIGDNYAWYNEFAYYLLTTNPWLARGGFYNNGLSAGAFAFYYGDGAAYPNSSFRPIVIVD